MRPIRTRPPTRFSTLGVELGHREAGPEGRTRQKRESSRSPCRPTPSTWSTGWEQATASADHCATDCWPGGRWRRYCGTPNAAGAIVASRLECSTADADRRRSPRSRRSHSHEGSQCLTSSPPAPSPPTYAEVTELRASDPQIIEKAWAARTPRATVRGNGRLMIVAGRSSRAWGAVCRRQADSDEQSYRSAGPVAHCARQSRSRRRSRAPRTFSTICSSSAPSTTRSSSRR